MLRALGQLFTHSFTREHSNELVPQKPRGFNAERHTFPHASPILRV